MKEFDKKRLLEVTEVNAALASGAAYVTECEEVYRERVGAVSDAIEKSGAAIVLVSGPSASGKTTSSHRIEQEMKRRGHGATVVSLDNYFKKLTDYPQHPDGSYDMEHIDALDVERVNADLRQLIETGGCEMPVYDFLESDRSDATLHIRAGAGDIVLIEGIHALNPQLTQLVPDDSKFGVYAGLRTEYAVDGMRVVATRDLRITRRMVRDYYFRGRSIQNTLSVWQRLMDGEERWIKPFKSQADLLLDTSFPYEPAVFLPILEELVVDPEQGGIHRDVLERLARTFDVFVPLDVELVPQNSMLREFLGGLML